jgi:hypothetical protein
MFVKNSTAHEVALPRGRFSNGVSVAAVVGRVIYRLSPAGLVAWAGARSAPPTDPPPLTEQALWRGASVTLAGTAAGPGRAQVPSRVTLRAGLLVKSVVVNGERRWVKNAGKLVPGASAPWERLPLSWDLAFGGTLEMPAGPLGPDKLPHPGGRFAHPMNPLGKGASLDEAAAEGRPLPNIESPDEPMTRPTDQPRPAGLAPCPDLPALRVPRDIGADSARDPEQLLQMMLRMAHPAAEDQVLDHLPPGSAVEVTGLVGGPLRFEVPPCPFQVSVRRGKGSTAIPATVRSLHVSADDGAVLVTYGHHFFYESAPSWVDVLAA